MDVRVLGCSGTYPSAHGPCSGYLVTGSESRVWIDCGTGTFAALQGVLDFTQIDALVVTHVHSDHCLDLYPYYYALRLHPEVPRGLPVYGPPGFADHMVRFITGDSHAIFFEVFEFHEIRPACRVEVGDLTLDFAQMDHPVPTFGVSVESPAHRMVYSADTGPGGELFKLASGADSLICEATYQNGHNGPPLHLSAADAGEVARQAGVGSLFLTHLFPTLDHRRSAEEAAQTFGDVPTVLESGMVLRADGRDIEPI